MRVSCRWCLQGCQLRKRGWRASIGCRATPTWCRCTASTAQPPGGCCSPRPAKRARYQALFRERAIDKTYEALAPALPGLAFPHVHRSRLVRGEPFFRMREVDGEANSETLIDVIERGTGAWHYRLQPVTGRKHQLRVHMA